MDAPSPTITKNGGMIGKCGVNPLLPRNCKRRGTAIVHWKHFSGKAADADESRSQETGPA